MNGPDKKNAWRDARVAGEYDARRFRKPGQRLKHRRDAALLLSLLRSAGEVRTVLDLPMGTGRLLPSFARAGYDAVGADISAEMLAMAGRRSAAGHRRPLPRTAGAAAEGPAWAGLEEASPLRCVQAEGEHLPFPDRAFDAVVSMRFLFHVQETETRRVLLREMARVASVVVIGQVRYRATAKHALRWARSRVGLSRRYRPSRGGDDIARELADAGLELQRLVPVSRLFSDKALFVARPVP